MSNPFSRTMRSLNADKYHSVFIWMIIALVVLSLWMLWFFTAKITIYKSSKRAYIIKEEAILSEFPGNALRVKESRQYSVLAEFSQEDMADIQEGQRAVLRIDGVPGREVGSVPAIVKYINPSKAQAKLFASLDANIPVRLQDGVAAKVMVKVRELSPAEMVMQASR